MTLLILGILGTIVLVISDNFSHFNTTILQETEQKEDEEENLFLCGIVPAWDQELSSDCIVE